MTRPAAAEGSAPTLRLGLLADVQYADKDDFDRVGDGRRILRYRASLDALRRAQQAFAEEQVELVVHLGDLIDGRGLDRTLVDGVRTSAESLEDANAVLDALDPALAYAHVTGNHCLYVPRDWFAERLGVPIRRDTQSRYYTRELPGGWRLIVLDTMDLSDRWTAGSAERDAAVAFRRDAPESPRFDGSFNGGVGQAQLSWLRDELAVAEEDGARCLVCSHHPLSVRAANESHVAWNAEEVSQAIRASPAVVAAFAGHYHPGGFATEDGVHFVTLHGVVEAPEGADAFAILDVHADRLELRGSGVVASHTLPVRAAA